MNPMSIWFQENGFTSIQVSGTSARLYVNGAEQPTLIVNDLKQPPVPGAIALWVGPGTIANFSDLEGYKMRTLVVLVNATLL
jgi:hypothetical protein